MKRIFFALLGAVLLPVATNAAPVTFDQTTLLSSSINSSLDTADVSKDGLTLTVKASSGGVVDDYTNTSAPPIGLAIGAPANGGVNTITNGNTNPSSGSYEFSFSEQITSFSFSFGFLTGIQSPVETLSSFAVDGTSVASGAVTATGLSGTTFSTDPAGDSLFANGGIRDGRATLSFTGSPFNAFSFLHEQSPQNLGFVITSVTVQTAAIPIPASILLLLSAVGGLSLFRRRNQIRAC